MMPSSENAVSLDDPNLRPLITTARQDIFRGLTRVRLYGRLGWLDTKRRYSRTVLGPFWGAVSLGIFVAALGSIGVGLWNEPASSYVPFLAAGLVVWVMIQSIVSESCGLFISANNLFRQMRLDYSILAYALVWRNLIAFAHTVLVYLLAAAIFAPSNLGWNLLLVPVGLVLVSINAVWISLFLGMACLRYRDLQQLVANIVQIGIFVTPIFWPPTVLESTHRVVFVTLNPLFHAIQVVRLPLLNDVPTVENYGAMLAMAACGWVVTSIVFSRFRRFIPFWA